MKGIDNWSMTAGIVLVILGIILLAISLFAWFVIFYALFALILGIVILVTLRKQEEIEGIRKDRVRKRIKRKGSNK
jgi:multisubunit Na+/H+ antiporter MnhG subunit